LFVKSSVEAPQGKTQDAVAVPATALLYHQGRALVYVCVEPGKYERREVQILGRVGNLCVVLARQGLSPFGLAPGDEVVFRQAQLLLSEEFRSEVDNDG